MKRLLLSVILSLVISLALTVPLTVSADTPPDDAVAVTIIGDGTWEDGHLSVSLFPGESKLLFVAVHNNLDQELCVSVVVSPECIVDSDVVACVCPDEVDLAAGESCAFDLTVEASGAAPPGAFSFNLSVETSIEVSEPDPEPDEPEPEEGVPGRLALSIANITTTVGGTSQIEAIVYDASDNPLPGVLLNWSVMSGGTVFVDKDVVTDSDGTAVASVSSDSAGGSVVKCQVASNASISDTVTLVWTAASDGNGDGDGDGGGDDTVPKKGLPAWLVFIIGVGIIGAVFGGLIYYRRWQARKSSLYDPFAGLSGGGGEKDEDKLDLD